MILANCFSGFVGYFFSEYSGTMPTNPLRFDTDELTDSWFRFTYQILGYYVAAVVLEWPFCYWLIRFHDSRFRIASIACLAAQASSYTLLIALWCIVT